MISVAAGAVCIFQNLEAVEINRGFPVVSHHRCEVRGYIYLCVCVCVCVQFYE